VSVGGTKEADDQHFVFEGADAGKPPGEKPEVIATGAETT